MTQTAPRFTVLCNLVSPENGEYVGTSWEFFADLLDAEACARRHQAAGDVPTLRPFNELCDRPHMGAVHRTPWEPSPEVVGYAKTLRNHAWLERFRKADYGNKWNELSPQACRDIAVYVDALLDRIVPKWDFTPSASPSGTLIPGMSWPAVRYLQLGNGGENASDYINSRWRPRRFT